MQKHYNYLDIDLDSKNYRRLSAMQGDIKSRYILVNLYSNNLSYDLTDCTVKIYGLKRDKTIFFNNAVITNEKLGQFEIELTNQALAVAGELKIQILILGTSGEKLTSSAFFIDVGESIIDENAIESANEFNVFTQAMKDFQKWDGKFKEKYDGLEAEYAENITELGSQIKDNEKHVMGWVNVKSFGCKGDGVNDDTENFQRALDTGLNVLVPNGTYLVGDLKMCKGQILDGLCSFIYSWNHEKKKTVLLAKEGANHVISDCRGAVVKNIHICGNGRKSHGVFCGSQTSDEFNQVDGNTEVLNCRIYECDRGIDCARCGTVIHKNNIDNNNVGIYHMTDSRILNNTINLNAIGIYAYESNDNQICNNKIEWNSEEGIKFDRGVHNLVNSNTIDRNSFGIRIIGADRLTITGNVLRRNLEYNISYEGVNRCTTIGNNLIAMNINDDGTGEEKPIYQLNCKSLEHSVIQCNTVTGGNLKNPVTDHKVNFIIKDNVGTNTYADKLFLNFTVEINPNTEKIHELEYPNGYTQLNTHITSIKIGENTENFKINSDVVTYKVIMNTDKIQFTFKNTDTQWRQTIRVRLILEKEY